MLKKILTFLYHILFIGAPLIMFGKTSELFEFNKMIFIYFCASSIAVILFIYRFVYRIKPIKFSFVDVFIALFVLFQLISTLFSIDIHTSFFGYYGRFNGGFYSILSYIVIYYGFTLLLFLQDNPTLFFYRFLKISLLVSLLTILWSIPGKLGHDLSCLLFVEEFNNSCWTAQFNPAERMFSTLGQPNWFGAYLAVHFFIGLFFLIKNRKNNFQNLYKSLYFIYLIFNFGALLFTKSRSAIGSVGIGFIFFLLYYCSVTIKSKLKMSKIFVALFISMVLMVMLLRTGIDKLDKLFLIDTYSSYFGKSQSKPVVPIIKISEKENVYGGVTDSFDIRKIVWKGAYDLGKEYFLFGTGVETFAYSYYFVRPKEHNLTSEWDYLYNKAHNEYLNYFATTGLFGTFTYLIFIFACLLILIKSYFKAKNDKDLQLLFVILFLSYLSILITNFFGFSTTTINLLFYVIPTFPIFYFFQLNTSPQLNKNTHKSDSGPLGYLMILVPYFFVIIFLSNYWTSDVRYAMGDVYMRMNDYGTASTLFEQALENHYEHVYEDKLSNCYANLAFIASYQKEKDKTIQYIQKAQDFNNRSLTASSSNIIYLKTTVKNDYLFYQITLNKEYIEKGLNALKKAKIFAPTDSKITYYLATYYSLAIDEEIDLSRKKTLQDMAIESINESINQKPDYFDSYLLKIQLLKKFGNKKEAKKIIEFTLKQFDPKNETLLKELESL